VRFTLSRSALAALALAGLAVACSSSPSSSDSTTDAPQGPLSGTYSTDSLEGDAPFAAITFLDQSHYQYVAKTCLPPDTGVEGAGLGDDPGDPVADGDASASTPVDPTDDGCIHTGTYTLSNTTLTLTDEGESKGIALPLAALDADGDEVEDPDATSTVGESDGGLIGTQALGTRTFGDSTVEPRTSLILNGSSLLGSSSVSQFSVGGTHMRRTGLVSGSGVGTACTIGSGQAGVCQKTSTCTSQGKVSTQNFCPGPNNVQCCTTKTSSSSTGTDDTGTGTDSTSSGSDGSLVTNGPVALASQWVTVQMPYCQAANGGSELSAACRRLRGTKTCNRTGAANKASWNSYRSDCSGLVSYAWGLKAPGLTTNGFVPGAAKYIPMQDLQPGDALIRPGRHMVLFKKWTNKDKGTATVIAEPGCAAKTKHATEQNWTMGKKPGAQTSAHWSGGTYYAIRSKTSFLTAK